ncbi:hypothetical protein BKA69DRAFT_1039891 [Paraphysoderma sedebokerense]|nr:hypothetical protein BKA69DRAFT_1039891 [Paraphysoderma sedebokerense]
MSAQSHAISALLSSLSSYKSSPAGLNTVSLGPSDPEINRLISVKYTSSSGYGLYLSPFASLSHIDTAETNIDLSGTDDENTVAGGTSCSISTIPLSVIVNTSTIYRILRNSKSHDDFIKLYTRIVEKHPTFLSERIFILLFLLYFRLVDKNSQFSQPITSKILIFECPEITKSYLHFLNSLSSPLTPVFYTEDEIKLLKGTSLFGSVAAKVRKLHKEWEVLEQVWSEFEMGLRRGKKMGETDGVCLLNFEDFKWADSIYWSRVLEYPMDKDSWIAKFAKFSVQKDSIETLTELESLPPAMQSLVKNPTVNLIPFLDFANHSFHPTIRWNVNEEKGLIELVLTETGKQALRQAKSTIGVDKSPHTLTEVEKSIQIHAPLDSDIELTIDYGPKPSSELVFSYGFAVPDNPNTNLHIQIVEEWNELMMYSEGGETMQLKAQVLQELGGGPVLKVKSNALNENELKEEMKKSPKERLEKWFDRFSVWGLTLIAMENESFKFVEKKMDGHDQETENVVLVNGVRVHDGKVMDGIVESELKKVEVVGGVWEFLSVVVSRRLEGLSNSEWALRKENAENGQSYVEVEFIGVDDESGELIDGNGENAKTESSGLHRVRAAVAGNVRVVRQEEQGLLEDLMMGLGLQLWT